MASNQPNWPALDYPAWQDSCTTLHMWTQIVGKTRLRLAPFENHWWNCALYVTPRGLSTSAMPCGDDLVEVEFGTRRHRCAPAWQFRQVLRQLAKRARSRMRLPVEPIARQPFQHLPRQPYFAIELDERLRDRRHAAELAPSRGERRG